MLRTFTAGIERCPFTGLFVAHVPGIAVAHTQADTLDELGCNMKEVLLDRLSEANIRKEAKIN